MKYIKQFQRENGLNVDGIIGKNTFSKMREVFKLNRSQLAHFLGQTSHETNNFNIGVENLNYSARGLRRTFGKYFKTNEKARRFAYQPQKIANLVYGKRLGNKSKNDGWHYRGRGSIQLTGKLNYLAFAKWTNYLTILEEPDLVSNLLFWEVGLWYFRENGLFEYCRVTDNNIKTKTKKINGGYNGLEHRINLTKHYYIIGAFS